MSTNTAIHRALQTIFLLRNIGDSLLSFHKRIHHRQHTKLLPMAQILGV
jgi:hypothetical protein